MDIKELTSIEIDENVDGNVHNLIRPCNFYLALNKLMQQKGSYLTENELTSLAAANLDNCCLHRLLLNYAFPEI